MFKALYIYRPSLSSQLLCDQHFTDNCSYNHQFIDEGVQGSEWLSNLPKVTQLVNEKAGIQSQAVWMQDLCSSLSCPKKVASYPSPPLTGRETETQKSQSKMEAQSSPVCVARRGIPSRAQEQVLI